MLETDKKSLELFNKQVEKLERGTFIKFLKENKGTSIEINFNNVTKQGSIKTIFPDDDAIDSALLKIRLFRDDKDEISINKIQEIYERLAVKKEKEQYNVLRTNFNNFLDSSANIKFRGKDTTHREVFEVVLYGERAHVNREKVKIVEDWFKHPILENILHGEFINLMIQFYFLARKIAEMNKTILERMKGSIPIQ